jgi:hypothetical protein
VNYCIVSDEYWPSLHVDSSITHHPRAASLQALYTSTFDHMKKPKKLEVAAQLGQVFLELDFDDGTTREFTVSPTQVSAWGKNEFVALFYVNILHAIKSYLCTMCSCVKPT